MVPQDLRYAETHEWVRVASEGGRKVGTVGITAFALEQLTDLVHMVLPKVGTQVTSGQPFGEVESVKAVSDLYSPVDGEVVEVNEALDKDPAVINRDPYGDGWMIRLKVKSAAELDQLLDATDYAGHIGE